MSKLSDKSPLQMLMEQFPNQGKVEWIGIRPKRKAPLSQVEEVKVEAEIGLQGDHYKSKGGKRQVTLIQKEHLAVIQQLIKSEQPVDPADLRRNIVVSGINLLALHKGQIQIGSTVVLEITGYCHPCSRMEKNLGQGGYNVMRGHGGMTAKIIRGGMIRNGDSIQFIGQKK